MFGRRASDTASNSQPPVIRRGVSGESALKAVVIYLLIYALSNLGAFAVVIAVALALIVNVFRHYKSGDVDHLNRLRG